MKNSETKDFIAYEYLTLNVKAEHEALYIDCYENFGWTLVNNTALVDKDDYYINNYSINYNKLVKIKFKRDRKIKNKVKLLSLQRKLETALKEMDRLERQPNTAGIIVALTIGVIGTIFLAISVFAITATNPLYFLGTLTGIIGLVGWMIGFLSFGRVKATKAKENVPLIEEQYNIIYDSCEQAKKLSN